MRHNKQIETKYLWKLFQKKNKKIMSRDVITVRTARYQKKNIILFYNLSFSETARLIYFIFVYFAYICSAVIREALNVYAHKLRWPKRSFICWVMRDETPIGLPISICWAVLSCSRSILMCVRKFKSPTCTIIFYIPYSKLSNNEDVIK